MNEDGTFKGVDAVNEAMATSGIDLSKALVTNCNTGVGASVLQSVIMETGRAVAVYDGSYSEFKDRIQNE